MSTDGQLPPPKQNADRGEQILVAEDNFINQEVIKLYLMELGFSCQIVGTGQDAVAAIAAKEFALIFMDCQMPDKDGLAATSLIRKQESHASRHLPIIAMTANQIEGDREKCIAAGMDDYINKPFDRKQIRLVIEKWLPNQNLTELVRNPQDEIAKSERKPPPVDTEAIKSKFGAHADRLIDLFLIDSEFKISELKKALEAKDADSLSKRAHALKGACSIIFANAMHQTCVDILLISSKEAWQSLATCIDRLENEFKEARKILGKSKPE